jgi:hypothetical protein
MIAVVEGETEIYRVGGRGGIGSSGERTAFEGHVATAAGQRPVGSRMSLSLTSYRFWKGDCREDCSGLQGDGQFPS